MRPTVKYSSLALRDWLVSLRNLVLMLALPYSWIASNLVVSLLVSSTHAVPPAGNGQIVSLKRQSYDEASKLTTRLTESWDLISPDRSMLRLGHEPQHALSKRGEIAELACVSRNSEERDAEGQLVRLHHYSWEKAWCVRGTARDYRVTCHHTTFQANQPPAVDYDTVIGSCPDNLFCWKVQAIWNAQGRRVNDIECRQEPHPEKRYPPIKRTLKTGPHSRYGTTTCSKKVTLPDLNEPPPQSDGGGAQKTRRFLLEEEVVFANGSIFNAPDLVIVDVTTSPHRFIAETRRNEIASTEIDILSNAPRSFQFCMFLAAGWGYSVYFHFEATDITNVHRNI